MSTSTSRKRSAASSQSRPPEPPTYFLDRSLGRHKLAAALRQAGFLVEVHDDHFPQDATDEEWLTEVGQRRWVVLTKDEKIRYHARELNALVSHGVRAFILTARNVNADEMAAIVLGARAKIEKFLDKNSGPFYGCYFPQWGAWSPLAQVRTQERAVMLPFQVFLRSVFVSFERSNHHPR